MFIWKIRFEDLTVLEISIANEVFRDSQIILIYLTFYFLAYKHKVVSLGSYIHKVNI